MCVAAPTRAAAPSVHADLGAYGRTSPLSRATGAGVEAALDICAPCTDGSQCLASLCANNADGGAGTCMQACDASGACPTNFFCGTLADGTTLCLPNDDSVCANPYRAPKNVVCSFPGSADDPNAVIVRDCAPGLYCYRFPPVADGAGQAGVCVGFCSSTQASAACAPDETCCFDSAADGSCSSLSTAGKSSGGCFVVGDVGASCVAGDHSYCVQGSACIYPQVSTSAACYGLCSASSGCPPGGYCATVGGSRVCCNASTLNLNDLTTCEPLQGICRREVGVACSENSQCRLNVCQKNGSASACSVGCTSDADCPSEDVDANGDGVPDGGGACLDFGGVTRCWPVNGPANPPACARVQDGNGPAASHGCTCAGGEAAAGPLLAPLALLVRRWRRLRRRCRT